MLILVLYNQYKQSKILHSPSAIGLNFVALWPVPFVIFYSVLLYWAFRPMAMLKRNLCRSVNKFLGDKIEVLRNGATAELMCDLGCAAETRRWIKELPVLPIPNAALILLYGLNATASLWVARLFDLGKVLLRIFSTGS